MEVDRIDDRQGYDGGAGIPGSLETIKEEIIRLGGDLKSDQCQVDEVKRWMAAAPSLPAGEEKKAMRPFPLHAWEDFMKTCEKHLERLGERKRDLERALAEVVRREHDARALAERGRLVQSLLAPVRYCRNFVISLAKISEAGEVSENLEIS
ncbi:MAG: hypothetical protein AB2L14_33665 [Candidatus Xenobiia bacterium LiM19]